MLRINLALALSALLLLVLLAMTLMPAETSSPARSLSQDGDSDEGPLIPHYLVGHSNCLRCHEEGFGGANIMPADHGDYANEECQECHEPAEILMPLPDASDLAPGVIPTPLDHPAAEGDSTCFECHVALDDKHAGISEEWLESVHGEAGVGCEGCHGGDPNTDEMNQSMSPEVGFIGVPTRENTPATCGGCHSDVERMRQYNLPTDQYIKYMGSVHGTKLIENGDTKVALCIDCHGVHDIKKASDPSAAVYPLNVPELCASCHSDAKLMEPYGIPTNQFAEYQESTHGRRVLEGQDVRSPNCASCHGSHAAQPPDDEEVVNVCGKCHTATQGYYEESLHSRLEANSPKCWSCHGTHDVTTPDESLFISSRPTDKPCTGCHLDDGGLRADKVRFERPEDRLCDTCHHEGSWILTQVEALHTSLTEADQAYKEADETIQQAAARGMIVTEAEVKLAEAHTSLISARATVHTTKLPRVTALTDDAKASAVSAKEVAADKLGENLFRRQAMVVAVALIAVNIVILSGYKRKLNRQLKEEESTGE
jgi:hypothetical protein